MPDGTGAGAGPREAGRPELTGTAGELLRDGGWAKCLATGLLAGYQAIFSA